MCFSAVANTQPDWLLQFEKDGCHVDHMVMWKSRSCIVLVSKKIFKKGKESTVLVFYTTLGGLHFQQLLFA